jgi:replicative DNA helicase
MSIELEALASLAATAQLSPEDAQALMDSTYIAHDDFAHPIASRIAPMLIARIREKSPMDFIAMRELLNFWPGSPEADALLMVLTDSGGLGVATERLSMVHGAAIRRRCVDSMRVLAGIIRDEKRSVDEVVSEAQSVVAGWRIDAETAPTMEGDVEQLLSDLDDIYNDRRAPVLKTGIEALDVVIGGLQPTLTVVGAQPNVGKSALVAALCRNLALAGHHVGLVSLEDDRSWLVRRITSDFSNIGIHSMLTKKLSRFGMEAVGDGASKAHALGKLIHIDGRSGLTAAEVIASARSMLARGCKAILVDHLGEIRLEGKTERHDLEISAALQQLRGLAKTYRVPVVVMSHLRRRNNSTEAQYDEPTLTDFAFSAGVERMARVALGLYRVRDEVTGERDQTLLRCAVLKQTQGLAGISVTMRLKAIAAIVTDSPASDAGRKLYDEENS